jgi:hypothetical protein
VTDLSYARTGWADTAGMSLFLRSLLLLLALQAPTAAPAAPPLVPAEARALMTEIAAASDARDVKRLAATLAADCRIELRTLIEGQERVTLYTRDDYLAMLEHGYAAMADLEDYHYAVHELSLTLETDPPAATLVSAISESFTFQGRHRETRSEETSRLERRDGRLMLVAVSSLTRGD